MSDPWRPDPTDERIPIGPGDVITSVHRHRTSRRTSDAVLREAMAATGVSWIRRWAWWLGVRLFGRSCW